MIGTKVLEERESKYNGHLRVVKTLGLGTYIQANGLTQSGGIVETFWKQTLRQIKSSKLKVQSCLVLGLGGGTAAKLIQKFWPKAKITGIEIDLAMIKLGERYLGFDRTGIQIKIQDASDYTLYAKRYDLVVIDLYNGDKFPEKFREVDFLEKVKKCLSENGIAVFNRTYYGDKRPETVKFGRKLEKVFPNVKWFYPEANLMFICNL